MGKYPELSCLLDFIKTQKIPQVPGELDDLLKEVDKSKQVLSSRARTDFVGQASMRLALTASNSMGTKNCLILGCYMALKYINVDAFVNFVLSDTQEHYFKIHTDDQPSSLTNKKQKNAASSKGKRALGRDASLDELAQKAVATAEISRETGKRRKVVLDLRYAQDQEADLGQDYFVYDNGKYSQGDVRRELEKMRPKEKLKTRGEDSPKPPDLDAAQPALTFEKSEIQVPVLRDSDGDIEKLFDKILSPEFENLTHTEAGKLIKALGGEIVRPAGGSSHMHVKGLTDACFAQIESEVAYIGINVGNVEMPAPEEATDQKMMLTMSNHGERHLSKAQFFDLQALILRFAVRHGKTEAAAASEVV